MQGEEKVEIEEERERQQMFACYTAADELMLRLLSMLGSPSKVLIFCELPRMVEGEETSAPNVSELWGERTSLPHA